MPSCTRQRRIRVGPASIVNVPTHVLSQYLDNKSRLRLSLACRALRSLAATSTFHVFSPDLQHHPSGRRVRRCKGLLPAVAQEVQTLVVKIGQQPLPELRNSSYYIDSLVQQARPPIPGFPVDIPGIPVLNNAELRNKLQKVTSLVLDVAWCSKAGAVGRSIYDLLLSLPNISSIQATHTGVVQSMYEQMRCRPNTHVTTLLLPTDTVGLSPSDLCFVFPQLRELQFAVTDGTLIHALRGWPQLHTLRLHQPQPRSRMLLFTTQLTQLTALRCLDIGFQHEQTEGAHLNAYVPWINTTSQLTELQLSHMAVSQADNLGSLSNIECLVLRSCKYQPPDGADDAITPTTTTTSSSQACWRALKQLVLVNTLCEGLISHLAIQPDSVAAVRCSHEEERSMEYIRCSEVSPGLAAWLRQGGVSDISVEWDDEKRAAMTAITHHYQYLSSVTVTDPVPRHLELVDAAMLLLLSKPYIKLLDLSAFESFDCSAASVLIHNMLSVGRLRISAKGNARHALLTSADTWNTKHHTNYVLLFEQLLDGTKFDVTVMR